MWTFSRQIQGCLCQPNERPINGMNKTPGIISLTQWSNNPPRARHKAGPRDGRQGWWLGREPAQPTTEKDASKDHDQAAAV